MHTKVFVIIALNFGDNTDNSFGGHRVYITMMNINYICDLV